MNRAGVFKFFAGSLMVAAVAGLVIGSFTEFGGGRSSISNTNVATVGDVTISTQDFHNALEDRRRDLSSLSGRNIPMQQAIQRGLDKVALNALINQAVLQDYLTQQLNYKVPPSGAASWVASLPAFIDPETGSFSKTQLERFLKNQAISKRYFLEEVQTNLALSSFTDAFLTPTILSEDLVGLYARFQNEKRRVQYITFDTKQINITKSPPKSVLELYYQEHADQFEMPEQRQAKILVIRPSVLKNNILIEEADIASYYQDNISAYTTPQSRHVMQILFPQEQQAQDIYNQFPGTQSLKSLEKIAENAGMDREQIDLGTYYRANFPQKSSADIIFDLPEKQLSQPVKTDFGYAMYYVAKINPKVVQPLPKVAQNIKETIASEEAQKRFYELLPQIEEAQASGQTLEEISDRYSLPLQKVTFSPNRIIDNLEWFYLQDKIFSLKEQQVSPMLVHPNNTEEYVVFRLDNIEPAYLPSFETIKNKIISAWHNKIVSEHLQKKLADWQTELQKGNIDLKKLSKLYNQKQQDIVLERTQSSIDINSKLHKALFSLSQGQAAFARVSDGKYIFAVVEEILSHDSKKDEFLTKMSQKLSESITVDLYQQFISYLRKKRNIEVNPEVIEQALQGL